MIFMNWPKDSEYREKRRDKILLPYLEKQPMVKEFVRRSFLDYKTKRAYLLHYQTKRNQLNAF